MFIHTEASVKDHFPESQAPNLHVSEKSGVARERNLVPFTKVTE